MSTNINVSPLFTATIMPRVAYIDNHNPGTREHALYIPRSGSSSSYPVNSLGHGHSGVCLKSGIIVTDSMPWEDLMGYLKKGELTCEHIANQNMTRHFDYLGDILQQYEYIKAGYDLVGIKKEFEDHLEQVAVNVDHTSKFRIKTTYAAKSAMPSIKIIVDNSVWIASINVSPISHKAILINPHMDNWAMDGHTVTGVDVLSKKLFEFKRRLEAIGYSVSV